MISSGSCWRGCVRNAPNDFPRIPSIVVQAPSLVDAVDVVVVVVVVMGVEETWI
jgi:hypothetical protein